MYRYSDRHNITLLDLAPDSSVRAILVGRAPEHTVIWGRKDGQELGSRIYERQSVRFQTERGGKCRICSILTEWFRSLEDPWCCRRVILVSRWCLWCVHLKYTGVRAGEEHGKLRVRFTRKESSAFRCLKPLGRLTPDNLRIHSERMSSRAVCYPQCSAVFWRSKITWRCYTS
jgi:hypothetical protein